MDTEERTDYRKATPDVLYQMRKTVISMNKRKKTVEEIIEDTGFCERTSGRSSATTNVAAWLR